MANARRRGSWIILVALLLALGIGWSSRQSISDWFRLLGYTPTAAVSALAQADTMTPAAEHLYYINHPEIIAKDYFATRCTTSEKTIVLGCYHSPQSGIFILRVSGDSRLDGVMQVTAAHEMLHAAYDRLSETERAQINGWLQDYYNHQLKDKRIEAAIASYRETEPNDVVNEMHSIFATEIIDLPPQLENYYQRYFTDRQKVAQFTADYRAEFTKREALVAAYDKRLKSLNSTIKANEKSLDQQADAIHREQARLDSLKSAKRYDEYNAGVDPYNQSVRDYNILLSKTKAEIAEYNQLVAQRNVIALETQKLSSELQGGDFSTIN
ncbi:hypothetical protein KDA23_04575 [Candidatus Saccharibacteria bacterium]|nr:hypothetical protein [Candidatus Saccharibacteria bacterium]